MSVCVCVCVCVRLCVLCICLCIIYGPNYYNRAKYYICNITSNLFKRTIIFNNQCIIHDY